MLIEYCTTRSYCLYLELFKQSLLAGTITIYWQAILVSIKQKNLLFGNIISQAWKRMLKLISKVEIFAWLWKRLGINYIVIYRPCQYKLIARKTSL